MNVYFYVIQKKEFGGLMVKTMVCYLIIDTTCCLPLAGSHLATHVKLSGGATAQLSVVGRGLVVCHRYLFTWEMSDGKTLQSSSNQLITETKVTASLENIMPHSELIAINTNTLNSIRLRVSLFII